ncbi:hypothetical protein GVO57_10355 [Sphingomonas changnyeongensis]|uniref:WD40 repeat domain-containing protein n=1 Tax=Sphingomonas changnyeongensis TaxID=2698679 RepID=A0A7Z2NWJ7_9SPHN|nr:WD40 repeat domain-containing protein [Sphingomonas changnyeongensis]QHL91146.1 hypothetical protein GVO57_10355 [Sphingomonas changnyeongensis]
MTSHFVGARASLVAVAALVSPVAAMGQGDAGQSAGNLYEKNANFSATFHRGDAEAGLPHDLVPGTKKYAIARKDGTIDIVDYAVPDTQSRVKVIPDPLPSVSGPIQALGALPNGDSLIVAANNGRGGTGYVARIDLNTSAPVYSFALPEQMSVNAINNSRDGRLIAVTGYSFERRAVIKDGVASEEVTNNVLSCRLFIFDALTGRQLFALEPMCPHIGVFSHDSTQLIVAGAEKPNRGIIQFWNAGTGKRTRTLTLPTTGPLHVARLNPDGQTLAVVKSTDGSPAVVRAADGVELFALRGHKSAVPSIRYNADGSRLLTGGQDFEARLWDARTGALLATLPHGSYRERKPTDYVAADFLSPLSAQDWDQGPNPIITRSSHDDIWLWEDGNRHRQRIAAKFAEDLRLAEQGNMGAMRRVTNAYTYGDGIKKDLLKARYWNVKLAEAGVFTYQATLAVDLIRAATIRQDCAAAGELYAKMREAFKGREASQAPEDVLDSSSLGLVKGSAFYGVGDPASFEGMPSQVRADLLGAQMVDALTKKEYQRFLAHFCAFEFLGHSNQLPPQARNELIYQRAVALRAENKPVPALDALNTYLANAGRDGANYGEALMMLTPLQAEAARASAPQ